MKLSARLAFALFIVTIAAALAASWFAFYRLPFAPLEASGQPISTPTSGRLISAIAAPERADMLLEKPSPSTVPWCEFAQTLLFPSRRQPELVDGRWWVTTLRILTDACASPPDGTAVFPPEHRNPSSASSHERSSEERPTASPTLCPMPHASAAPTTAT